jgi:hypothetical protein
MASGWWELIFLMFVMKLPILYLIGVVWWAVRAAPDPYEPAALVPAVLPLSPRPTPVGVGVCPWRGRHPRPHHSPRVHGPRRVAMARALR